MASVSIPAGSLVCDWNWSHTIIKVFRNQNVLFRTFRVNYFHGLTNLLRSEISGPLLHHSHPFPWLFWTWLSTAERTLSICPSNLLDSGSASPQPTGSSPGSGWAFILKTYQTGSWKLGLLCWKNPPVFQTWIKTIPDFFRSKIHKVQNKLNLYLVEKVH